MLTPRGPTWTPQPEDYEQTLREQNPWHATGAVPELLAPRRERSLARGLWRRMLHDEPRRFQLMLGPRWVGKTTCLYQSVRRLLAAGMDRSRVWWLQLDHPLLMQVGLDRLVDFVIQGARATAENPAFLFLDELTYAESWDLWLKTFYDRRLPIRLAGSSSSTAALRHRKLESGVGRWEEQYLASYLFTEYLELLGTTPELPRAPTLAAALAECIQAGPQPVGLEAARRTFLLTGGFPELLLAPERTGADEASALLRSQRILRADAVERAIYKDIPQVFRLDSPTLLERLLYTLAGQMAGVLSCQSLCRTLGGMTQPTFDRYLSYLERAFLVFTLPNYGGSEATIQKRGRKLYFVDGAVRNAALQRGLAPLEDAAEMGLLAENLAAGHLHALAQQSSVRLYHWRDQEVEVDLVFDHPTCPLAFEIGFSRTHHRKGLQAFRAKFPRFDSGCYLVSPQIAIARKPEESPDGVGSLPLDLLLLAVGACAAAELVRHLGGAGVAPFPSPPSAGSA
ncbi:MAG: ATP-binding protein [Planctomycetes bacterium]|nr:ATP-binding protein [Planctomycetota bacterium]